jgi:CRP/FNR family transcriptional regulator
MNILTPEYLLHNKCSNCSVHNRRICSTAGSAAAEELNRLGRIRHIPAGQTITTENAYADFYGNVVSGVVKITKTLKDGRQQIVGLLFPSDFFGRPFQDVSRFSFEAATDLEICVFERHAFEALLKRHPEVEHELLKVFLNELDATREWSVLLGCQKTRERIAGFLLMLLRRNGFRGCSKDGQDANGIINLPISRKDIAMYLGMTLETISRQLQAMSRAGILKRIDSNQFEILLPRRLAEIATHEEWLIDDGLWSR